MSNKKRIQKKLSNINLNFEIKKFQIAMKILNALIEKQNQKDKLLKLVSGAVEPKGLITEEGKEMIVDITEHFRFNVDENVRAIMDNSLINAANSLRDMGKAIEKGNNNFLENLKSIKIEIPKQRVGFLGLEKQKEGSVKTVFAGSEDYKEKLP